MKTVFPFVFAASVISVTGPASSEPTKAESHLEPERSQYGGDLFMPGYHALVRSVLRDAFDHDVVVRMVAVPSFIPEFAVGLRRRSGNYQVFSLRPKVQLWGYETLRMVENGSLRTVVGDGNKLESDLRATLPPSPNDVPVISCQTGITLQLGERIVSLWERMLRSTRFPSTGNLGTDGSDYHFAMRVGDQFLAGRTWSPDINSTPGILVGIGAAMNNYCDKKSVASIRHLEQQVRRLEDRLTATRAEPRYAEFLNRIRNWFSGWRQAH